MSEQQTITRHELETKIIAKAWQDEAFKQELLSNPKAVFSREIGQNIPENVEIQIVEENPTTLYMVLPMKPNVAATGELSEEELETVAGGNLNLGNIWNHIVNSLSNGVLRGC